MRPFFGQTPTVGLRYSAAGVSDGYTLFTPEKNNKVFLVNNCGEKINEWEFSENPGLTCYLQEDGNIMRVGADSIEVRDWNNNQLWSFSAASLGINKHHDIEPMPNGNVLIVARIFFSYNDIIQMGRDSSLAESMNKLDAIYEVEPVGAHGGNIVWEWHFTDHFVQEYDALKPNYGVVEDHPELINMNFDNGIPTDYTHVNAVDYNAELDQILISARHLSEIYIIDHSTTTAEAASHNGGNSNKGGDILWRWGNTQIYGVGTGTDSKLGLQHDAKWVEAGYLDEGKISVFDNLESGVGPSSAVHLIEPIFDGIDYTMSNGYFLPLDYDWSWNGDILGVTMNESNKSGCHGLQNGNFIFCESGKGQITEVNKQGDVLWVYKNPIGSSVTQQYDNVLSADNKIFRGEKYPVDYAGFIGKDMTPLGIIEDLNPISDTCSNELEIAEVYVNGLSIINPVIDGEIIFVKYLEMDELTIYDISGRILFYEKPFNGNRIQITSGSKMAFIVANKGKQRFTHKIIEN